MDRHFLKVFNQDDFIHVLITCQESHYDVTEINVPQFLGEFVLEFVIFEELQDMSTYLAGFINHAKIKINLFEW